MSWVRLSPKPERNLGPSTQPYLNTEESSEGGGGEGGKRKEKGKEKESRKELFFLIQPLEVAKIIILM